MDLTALKHQFLTLLKSTDSNTWLMLALVAVVSASLVYLLQQRRWGARLQRAIQERESLQQGHAKALETVRTEHARLEERLDHLREATGRLPRRDRLDAQSRRNRRLCRRPGHRDSWGRGSSGEIDTKLADV